MIANINRLAKHTPASLIGDALGLAAICAILLSTLFLPGLL